MKKRFAGAGIAVVIAITASGCANRIEGHALAKEPAKPALAASVAEPADFDPSKKYPVNSHPVITRHPVSKRKVIYVNRGFTARINELSPGESAALLSFLYQHVEKPDFQVRFRWQKHSIAFWDNRCTQHLAIWDYYPNVRSGYRVQVEADRPPIAA